MKQELKSLIDYYERIRTNEPMRTAIAMGWGDFGALVAMVLELDREGNDRARQLLQVHDALAAEIRQLRKNHEAAALRVQKLEEAIRDIDGCATRTNLAKWNAPLQSLQNYIDEAMDLVNGFEAPPSGDPTAPLDLGVKSALVASPSGSMAMGED